MAYELKITGVTFAELQARLSEIAALFTPASDAGPAAEEPAAQEPAAEKLAKAPKASKKDTKPADVIESAAKDMPEPEITLADLQGIVQQLVRKGAPGAKAAVDVVLNLKAFNAEGQPKLDQVQPEQYAECKALLEAALVELDKPVGVL